MPTIKTNVGLYLEIENFGSRSPLSAAAPQPTEKTASFRARDFDVDYYDHAEYTNNGITVSLDNADEGNSYVTMGYRSWGTNYNGVMTISGRNITKVVISYSGTSYTGQVSASPSGYSLSGSTGTWTGNANEITFTMGRSGGNFARVSSIQVTYLSY